MAEPTRDADESQADYELRLAAYRKQLVDDYIPGVTAEPVSTHPAVKRRVLEKRLQSESME